LEAEPIDLELLRRDVFPQVRALLESGECTSLKVALERIPNPLPRTERLKEFGQILDDHYGQPLLRSKATYITWLLEYFRPGFDSYPYEKQIAFFDETCKRINELLTACRKLVSFLEYGAPNKDTRATVENIARDLRAAMFHEVGGLDYLQIAKVLGMPPPSGTNLEKRDHPTVRAKVKRGRKILEEAFGKEEWREKAQAMRSEAKQLVETGIEACAVTGSWLLDLPVDEVRSHVVVDQVTGKPGLDEKYAEKLGQKSREKYGEVRPKDQL